MAKKRRTFTREFKAKVALEALKEQLTISELAKKYSLHPNQVNSWKKQAKEDLLEVFGSGNENEDQEELISSLYEKIGRLEIQLDWLKKKSEQLRK